MSEQTTTEARALAQHIADRYAGLMQVYAVTLGGSHTTGGAEPGSDIDLYVYINAKIPYSVRASIPEAADGPCEIGNEFWEPGDEWQDEATGIHVDVMFRDINWIKKDLDRLFYKALASVGYTTCLWHNVLTALPLYDRDGWYADLQERAKQPYPDKLVEAIIAKNHPILRDTMSSYTYQITNALRRDDRVSLNHRVAALLASYFDILFAVNRQPHPGEKRLLVQAAALCDKRPPNMAADVNAVLAATAGCDEGLLDRVAALLDGLDDLLQAEGLIGNGTVDG